MRRDITALLAVLLSSTAAHAEITVPGADGSDGVFNPTANVTIDLSQATTLQWDQASPVAGKGVYDPNKWAVIFKYSSVNVPTGVTVTFKNHPSRAPVVWLVSGDVTIAGSVRLDGQGNAGEFLSEPGPGGFRGGRANGQANIAPPSGGFGPGGSPYLAGWASHRTAGYVENGKSGAVYGHALSLMGGSGGAGYHDRSGSALGGGAGGGAILIAATNSIIVGGLVSAAGGTRQHMNDGSGGGSGGTIRLVANTIQGLGSVTVAGYQLSPGVQAGSGYVRLEGNTVALAQPADTSYGLPGATAKIWPDASSPEIKVTMVNESNAPLDPQTSFDFPLADVSMSNPNAVTIRLECTNVPVNWNVKARIVPKSGQDFTVSATLVSGDQNASVWEVHATLPNGFCAVQARASKP